MYVEARKALKRGIRKAKRESWRAFTESTPDAKAAAKLFKCIQKCQNESIVKRPDEAPLPGPWRGLQV